MSDFLSRLFAGEVTPAALSEQIEHLNRRGHTARAMMVSTLLENWLKEALKSHFKNKSRDLLDGLFGFRDPLGSFSAKIDVAYAVGAISGETRRKLHVIRDIRNVLAHAKEDSDFQSEKPAKHFARLGGGKPRDYESLFIQSAADCIKDMKQKMRPMLLSEALLAYEASPKR